MVLQQVGFQRGLAQIVQTHAHSRAHGGSDVTEEYVGCQRDKSKVGVGQVVCVLLQGVALGEPPHGRREECHTGDDQRPALGLHEVLLR